MVYCWAAGADAVGTFEQKARDLLAQAEAYRKLSSSLGYEAEGAGTGKQITMPTTDH